jgi:hypothetical protein
MVCYQVLAQFAFSEKPLGFHKPVLVATSIKKQNAKVFLVLSRLPFGSGLKSRRFFKTKKEAAQFVSYLHRIYKNRIAPNPAMDGGYKNVAEFLQDKKSKRKISMDADFSLGQLYLFQEGSE